MDSQTSIRPFRRSVVNPVLPYLWNPDLYFGLVAPYSFIDYEANGSTTLKMSWILRDMIRVLQSQLGATSTTSIYEAIQTIAQQANNILGATPNLRVSKEGNTTLIHVAPVGLQGQGIVEVIPVYYPESTTVQSYMVRITDSLVNFIIAGNGILIDYGIESATISAVVASIVGVGCTVTQSQGVWTIAVNLPTSDGSVTVTPTPSSYRLSVPLTTNSTMQATLKATGWFLEVNPQVAQNTYVLATSWDTVVPANGFTDLNTALQTIGGQSGVTLYVEPGTYTLDQPVTLEDLSITGSNLHNTILNINTIPLVTVGVSVRNITLSSTILQTNNYWPFYQSASATQSTTGLFDTCLIQNTYVYPQLTTMNFRNCQFINITYYSDGGALPSTSTILTQCQFSNCSIHT